MTAAADQRLWAQLCRSANRRRRRIEIMCEHAGVDGPDDLPRCRPWRRPDGLDDKIVYPDEAAARACCAALLAEVDERQYAYRCRRRQRRGSPKHWHLTSQRT